MNNNVDTSLPSSSVNLLSHPELQFTLNSSSDDHGSAHTLPNNFHHPPSEQPSAFRVILFGDINLGREFKEMRLDIESGAVCRQSREGAVVWRMHTAEIRRDPGPVTVAIYEGHGAEDEWRKHVAKYGSIRHSNIMQLYGLVHTRGLCAMVFHNELIPFKQFIGRFQHSPVLTTYIQGYCCTELDEACRYLGCSSYDFSYSSVWIRPSTGNLSVDFFRASELDDTLLWWNIGKGPHLEDVSLNDPNAEAVIVSTFSEDEYHNLCSQPPIAQYWDLSVSTRLPIRLGSIFRSNSTERTLFRIAEPFNMNLETSISWERVGDEEVLPNGWIRYDSRQGRDLRLEISLWADLNSEKFWLAQANSIFTQIQETSHFDDYVCVTSIHFRLRCFPNTHNNHEPGGYLFVCPAEDLQTGPALFQWPDCPAYWSLESSGATRLSTEDAKALGFPVIHIQTVIGRSSWDKSVYNGLLRFHGGKGFDPDSRDVAKHLGYPFYTLLSEVDTPLPYAEDLWCGDWRDEACCQKLGHYLNDSTTSAPTAESITSNALLASEDTPVDPLVPRPPAKGTKPLLSICLSSFIFFLLSTVFVLSLLPTVA